jgi:2-(1,2-epoxy-1,2-dihydrophenyl)acetyl-CoA isomerase
MPVTKTTPLSAETLNIEISDFVARVELNRPEKRNALSPTMAGELADILTALESNSAVRVVLLRGAGGNFCSGGDLAPGGEADQRPSGSQASIALDIMNRVYGRAIRLLHHFPKPVVALVEGVAAGAGANLALACDLVYATPEARFSEIFVRRGLSLDCGGSWLLPRLVGLQKAKELAFFGDWVDAETAAGLGLVNEIFAVDRIEAAVREKLVSLASRAPIALSQIKQSLNRASSITMDQALEIEAVAQAACGATDDMLEGIRAFMEKREPKFEGR